MDIRELSAADLGELNAVIEAAVMGWDKSERVRRLALASCQYEPHDLEHLRFFGAGRDDAAIVGVVAWEPAEVELSSGGVTAIAVHGLYVHPKVQRSGVGKTLFGLAVAAARRDDLDGIYVKAMREAQGFFAHQGMRRIEVADPVRDYPYRYWLDLRRAGQR